MSAEALADDLALRLGPRFLPAASNAERWAFGFDGEELDPALLELGARLESPAQGVTLVFEAEGLIATAGRDARARLLLQVREAVVSEPAAPSLMGVVNVTPDSFSDGGRYFEADKAVEHGLELTDEGAQWLDVGGESTRPGASPVSVGEELKRVLPVIERLAASSEAALISIDTTKSEVARAALEAGAQMVNDISAGEADAGMLPLVAERGCRYVAMHRQGESRTMQIDPRYDDPVAEVCQYLRRRLAACLKAGIAVHKIWLDPGIGFGKRLEHNLDLISRLPELRSLGRPLLLGVSRKSFIGHLSGSEEQTDWRSRRRRDRPEQRLGGTAAAVAACVQGGAEVLRVHDVGVMAEAARVAHALALASRTTRLSP